LQLSSERPIRSIYSAVEQGGFGGGLTFGCAEHCSFSLKEWQAKNQLFSKVRTAKIRIAHSGTINEKRLHVSARVASDFFLPFPTDGVLHTFRTSSQVIKDHFNQHLHRKVH
jgi:hypothetical protein